ncbi:MAG: hypothetical protein WAW87_08655 [Candidatus Ferrigenium altingense]
MKHASDSSAQREAESHLIDYLNRTQVLKLVPKRCSLGNDVAVQLDGIDEDKRVICEAFAHIGNLKAAQSRKVTSDMLKLLLVEKHKTGGWRKILCFADQEAANDFQGKTWRAKAVTEFNFEVIVAKLPLEVLESISTAQKRQQMVNA